MPLRSLIISVFLVLFQCVLFAQESEEDIILAGLVREYGQAEVAVPISEDLSIEFLTRNFSVSSVDDKKILVRISPLTLEHFISAGYDYEIIDIRQKKGIVMAAGFSEALAWDKYPTYSQYDSIMRSFSTNYPELCHLDTIGTTWYGKLVLVLKISDNHRDDEDEPEVFFTSTMHGDETGGFILMMRLAEYILKNYSSNQRIRNLADNLEIWINPLANPDGTYLTGNTITNPIRFNSKGYDLNRNFPDPMGSTGTRQKETADMMKFLQERRFVLSANFHSGIEVVNYPWDRWLDKIHADDLWFYLLSRAYADTVHLYCSPGYMSAFNNGITRGAEWYVITGGRQDYVTYDLNGREVTIELDDNYITPVSELESLWQYNYRSLLSYLESAIFGIHGYVKDAVTGDPVPALITIPGHDKENSFVYSDSLTGRFTRLVNPQSWTLKFTAGGYLDTTIYNIPVFAGQKTEIEVRMVPVMNAIDTMNPGNPVLYPNPAVDYIKAVLPDSFHGPLNLRVFNSQGKLVHESETEAAKGLPVMLDLSGFSPGVYSIRFRSRVNGSECWGRMVVTR